MTNNLPPDLAAFVEAKVAAGEFATTDDVIVEGVRLMHDREERVAKLRIELQKGQDDIEQGRYIVFKSAADIDAFFDEKLRALREKYEAAADQT